MAQHSGGVVLVGDGIFLAEFVCARTHTYTAGTGEDTHGVPLQ